jgi:D-Ala-D-Ala carboxypeptidase 3 (S13) family
VCMVVIRSTRPERRWTSSRPQLPGSAGDEVLGGDYRFKTCFYLDNERVLYVRGGGDPFLISEDLAPLATKLVAVVGKEPINGIVLDASYYPSNLRIPGRKAVATPGGSGLTSMSKFALPSERRWQLRGVVLRSAVLPRNVPGGVSRASLWGTEDQPREPSVAAPFRPVAFRRRRPT